MAYTPKRNSFSRQPKMPKEEYAKLKAYEKDWAYKTIDEKLSEIKEFGKVFTDYLDLQSQFDRYTVANTILILSQRPDATQLKEHSAWNKLNVKVNKQAQKIKILEPSEFKTKDGKDATSYNVKYVYDIADTNSDYVPEPKVNRDAVELTRALLNSSPVDYRIADDLDNDMNAIFDDRDNILYIKKGVGDSTKLFQDVARELSLAEIAYNSTDFSRSESEFSAKCASYMLCKKYGIDTRGLNIPRVPMSWLNIENKDVRLYFTMARDSASTLGYRVYKELNKSKAPRNQDKNAR